MSFTEISNNEVIELLIEIEWSRTFSSREAASLTNKKTDYGLYCIYGNHPVSGANTLLYIGKASDQTFATRILQHNSWIEKESVDLLFTVGRVGSNKTRKYTNEQWNERIHYAESLLIHYLSPPYNTSSIFAHPITPKTLILNLGKRNSLPYCVTSIYSGSEFYDKQGDWSVYSYDKD